MKKACLVVAPPFNNGVVFDRTPSKLNRDDNLLFFHELQDIFLANGIDLNTHDINTPADCEYILYNEMPARFQKWHDKDKSFLLIFESELIRPDNWHVPAHQNFSKIFTWHDDFVDNIKYFKMNFTHTGQRKFLSFAERKKLCTLIAGNKQVNHPLELYSHRKDVIRWFEKKHLHDFEFFGAGWDLYNFRGPKFVRSLNRILPLRRLLAETFPSWRGPIDSKLTALSQYKFSICYENAKDIPGYITEKILDSLAAGCIPVYWGAPNVSEYFPELCYVDRTRFVSYEDLYIYLTRMTAEEYAKRLEAIAQYLKTDQHKSFEPRYTAQFLTDIIMNRAK